MLFQRKKILVAGDLLLDVYITGNVRRISPEAPVPIVQATNENYRPGGSGNVILNLISLGMDVVAFGRIGMDEPGQQLLESLREENVDVRGILTEASYTTPVKKRVVAAGQQLLRIDYEFPRKISASLEEETASLFCKALNDVDIVAISDYAKGFLTPNLLNNMIGAANEKQIPIIVDPKGSDFVRYSGATLLKPNLSEAIEAARLGYEASLEDVAEKIFEKVKVKNLMVTRAHEGITLFDPFKKRIDFPVQEVKDVKDVTGAGDTVLAVVTAAMSNDFSLSETARIANIAAGLAITRVGCARISSTELMLH